MSLLRCHACYSGLALLTILSSLQNPAAMLAMAAFNEQLTHSDEYLLQGPATVAAP
jgi:hypothetical protein